MADALIAPSMPRAIDEHVIEELAVLHSLSGSATSTIEEAEIREGLLATLFAIESLPTTRDHLAVRAQAVATLYGHDFTDWEDDSPSGVLVRQIIQTLVSVTH